MTDPARLIDRYLDGQLNDEEFAQLEQDLAGNPVYADAFAKAMMLNELMNERYERESIASSMQLGDGSFLGEQDLQHLRDDYDHAATDTVALVKIPDARRQRDPEDSVSWSEAVSALSYGVRLFIRSKPMPIVGTLAAAVLLLVFWVVNPLGQSNQPEPGNELTGVPALPQSQPVVAKLTAERDAVWEHRPGKQLYSEQRFTLSQGFAEITTSSGAVAILQAPATIELLDDNALRLYSGKLVGICETESSKGFVVQTQHLVITDLGTRFGVDASQADATEVHVFDGEVQVAHPDALALPEPVRLGTNQSARASAGSKEVAANEYAPVRFAAIRDGSGLGPPGRATVLDTDIISGIPWLITTSQYAGSVDYQGNQVTCSVDTTGFTRGVVGGNAYGFIQYQANGTGLGRAATATGTWVFSNLPAGRYDIATAFQPGGASAVRYTINGVEVLIDQSSLPEAGMGPSFRGGIKVYTARTDDIRFTVIGSPVVVLEGGTITVTIDNSNLAAAGRAHMDSVAITLVPEDSQD